MNTLFFTGKGDDGISKVGNRKLSKRHPFLAILGMLDETNSLLGLCRVEASRAFPAHGVDDIPIDGALKDIQNMLFVAQAELAARAFGDGPGIRHEIGDAHPHALEALIERIDAVVPKLSAFVVPGGTELSARLDYARTVVRRAERAAVGVHGASPFSPAFLAFLNRLSSALFALARYANYRAGVSEEHPRYA
jgi:cob(I)alamin adenosyltransferase